MRQIIYIIPFCLRCCALRASTWLTADLYRGSVVYIYIYIVCNYSQPVAAAVATDIYIYIYTYTYYIYTYININQVCVHIAGMHTARLRARLLSRILFGKCWPCRRCRQAASRGCQAASKIYIYIYILFVADVCRGDSGQALYKAASLRPRP